MCVKCDKRAAMLADSAYRNIWSGRLSGYPHKVWFDVSKAKEYLAAHPAVPVLVPIAHLWEVQVRFSEVVVEHLDHVNTADPILLFVTRVVEGTPYFTVVDGQHRVTRAHRDGVEEIPAIGFGLEASMSFMCNPREMVWEELFAEIEATGGRVHLHGATIIAIGGNPAPQTEDDHPYRAEALTMLKGNGGLNVFNLK